MGTDTEQLDATITEHLAGHWYWADLQAVDTAAAANFYGPLLHWSLDNAMPDGMGTYLMASRGGLNFSAIAELPAERQSAGEGSSWFNYVTTHDLEASVARARELGGTIAQEPFDVMEAGRMAVVVDPTGAAFALWQAGTNPGVRNQGVHGAPVWFELVTDDIAAALAFYEGLFGWQVEDNDMGEHDGQSLHYFVASSHGQQSCGLMQQFGVQKGQPSAWQTYFAVDDVDESHTQALDLGASEVMEPHDIPEVGRSSVLVDPQGASFHLFHPLPRAAG